MAKYACGKCEMTFGSVQGLGGHSARGHKRRAKQPKSNRDFKAMSDKARDFYPDLKTSASNVFIESKGHPEPAPVGIEKLKRELKSRLENVNATIAFHKADADAYRQAIAAIEKNGNGAR